MEKAKSPKRQLSYSQREPGGRPTLYNHRYVEIAAKMFAAGATMADLALRLGVAESTVYLWAKRHGEFSEAIKSAGRIADERIMASLYKQGVGYTIRREEVHVLRDGTIVRVPTTEYVKPNVAAAIFWLKNRDREHRGNRKAHEVDPAPVAVAFTFILDGSNNSPLYNGKEETEAGCDLPPVVGETRQSTQR